MPVPNANSTPIDVSLALAADGWAVTDGHAADEDRLSAIVLNIAASLGEVALGRGRRQVERIVPYAIDEAYRSSLSREHGLAPLPFHTDTAHWPVPCRYLVMACVEPGPAPAPTMLLDTEMLAHTSEERMAARTAVFLVRNGRHSFYGTIADTGRPFVRLDLGCMVERSEACRAAVSAYTGQQASSHAVQCHWVPGKVLVIDNWRTLHGRGATGKTRPGRILLRAMVR